MVNPFSTTNLISCDDWILHCQWQSSRCMCPVSVSQVVSLPVGPVSSTGQFVHLRHGVSHAGHHVCPLSRSRRHSTQRKWVHIHLFMSHWILFTSHWTEFTSQWTLLMSHWTMFTWHWTLRHSELCLHDNELYLCYINAHTGSTIVYS